MVGQRWRVQLNLSTDHSDTGSLLHCQTQTAIVVTIVFTNTTQLAEHIRVLTVQF